jgi:hypothetical protein
MTVSLTPALGVCYYPEHWPEAQWAEDAARMAETGLTWVRIGEFAWSRIEPEPGHYDWDWLDRAIETLAGAGIKVILGTPTATPPKWLVDKDARHGRDRRTGPPARLRIAAALLLQPRRLPHRVPPDYDRAGRAIRCAPGDRDVADRQRIWLPRHRAQLLRRRCCRISGLAGGALRHHRRAQRSLGQCVLEHGIP